MRLTRLDYRLKGAPQIYSKYFEVAEEAHSHLQELELQIVVGNLDGIPNPSAILEAAAARCKADWHCFSVEEK